MRPFLALLRWNLRWEGARAGVLALAAAVFMGLLIALSESVQPAEFQEVLERLPPMIPAALGLKRDRLLTIDRWVAIAHAHPLWIVLVLVYPVYLPIAAFARRIDDGSMEAILAQPASRTAYYLAAAVAVGAGIAAVLGASFLGGLVASRVADLPAPVSAARLLAHTVSGAALAWSVAGLSLLASAALAGRGRPGAWTLGAVVVLYFVEYLSRIWPAFRAAGALSLFHYHDPQSIANDGLAGADLAVLLAAGLVLSAAGLVVFRRRPLAF